MFRLTVFSTSVIAVLLSGNARAATDDAPTSPPPVPSTVQLAPLAGPKVDPTMKGPLVVIDPISGKEIRVEADEIQFFANTANSDSAQKLGSATRPDINSNADALIAKLKKERLELQSSIAKFDGNTDAEDSKLAQIRDRIDQVNKQISQLALAPRRQDIAAVKGAFLGVSVSPVTPTLSQQLKLTPGFGLIVESVNPKGPAALGGIQQYDILEKLDDQILILPQQLEMLVRSHKAGDQISFSLIHQGEHRIVQTRLVEHDLAPLPSWQAAQNLIVAQIPTDLPVKTPMRITVQEIDLGKPQITWADGQYTMHLSAEGPMNQNLSVTDHDGKQVFQGPVGTDEDRQAVPEELRGRLKALLGQTDLARQKAAMDAAANLYSRDSNPNSRSSTLRSNPENSAETMSGRSSKVPGLSPSIAGSPDGQHLIVWANRSSTYFLTLRKDQPYQLMIKTIDGQTLFDGLVDGEAAQSKIPPDLREGFDYLRQHPEAGWSLKR